MNEVLLWNLCYIGMGSFLLPSCGSSFYSVRLSAPADWGIGGDKERAAKAKRRAEIIAKAEKRKAEVDKLFTKLYEDWSADRITDYNFNMLSQKYQTEQQELTEKIDRLRAKLSAEQQTAVDAEKWIALIKQYANPTELTAELLNTLIKKIVIHAAIKTEDGIREQ